jgi:hypothetical protein
MHFLIELAFKMMPMHNVLLKNRNSYLEGRYSRDFLLEKATFATLVTASLNESISLLAFSLIHLHPPHPGIKPHISTHHGETGTDNSSSLIMLSQSNHC